MLGVCLSENPCRLRSRQLLFCSFRCLCRDVGVNNREREPSTDIVGFHGFSLEGYITIITDISIKPRKNKRYIVRAT